MKDDFRTILKNIVIQDNLGCLLVRVKKQAFRKSEAGSL
jgi:hypothetical protein